MPAPKGNKHAVGNKGGKPYSAKNRKKAGVLKGLVLDWAVKTMKAKLPKKPKADTYKIELWLLAVKKLEAEKHLVITKILPTCVNREIDVDTGDEDTPTLIIKL